MSSTKKIKIVYKNKVGTTVDTTCLLGEDTAILDLSEAEQLKIPFGCRVGTCGSCRVDVVKGEELLSKRSFLEEDTLQRHHDKSTIRLACRTLICKDLVSEGSVVVLNHPEDVFFKD